MAALVINTNIVNNYDGYLVDANAVKGGYIAVAGVGEDTKENLPAATVVEGTLVFDVNEQKSYRYLQGEWKEASDVNINIDNNFLILKDSKVTINPLYRSGYMAVANITARNSIDRTELEVGTRCWVETDKKFYKLTLTPAKTKVWEDDTQTDSFDGYATGDRHGTVCIGDNLKTDESGKLMVDVADREEEGSTKPISAGAVYSILGDIKSRLDNI